MPRRREELESRRSRRKRRGEDTGNLAATPLPAVQPQGPALTWGFWTSSYVLSSSLRWPLPVPGDQVMADAHSGSSQNLRCLLHLASQDPKTALLGGVLRWGHGVSLVGWGRKEREGSPETDAEGACWHSTQHSVQKGVRAPRCEQETGRGCC